MIEINFEIQDFNEVQIWDKHAKEKFKNAFRCIWIPIAAETSSCLNDLDVIIVIQETNFVTIINCTSSINVYSGLLNEIIAHDYETIYTLRCTKIAQVQN